MQDIKVPENERPFWEGLVRAEAHWYIADGKVVVMRDIIMSATYPEITEPTKNIEFMHCNFFDNHPQENLHHLQSLEHLSFRFSIMRYPKNLETLPNLRSVSFLVSRFRGVPETFMDCPNLKIIECISMNPFVTFPETSKKFKNLKFFKADHSFPADHPIFRAIPKKTTILHYDFSNPFDNGQVRMIPRKRPMRPFPKNLRRSSRIPKVPLRLMEEVLAREAEKAWKKSVK